MLVYCMKADRLSAVKWKREVVNLIRVYDSRKKKEKEKEERSTFVCADYMRNRMYMTWKEEVWDFFFILYLA